MYKCSSCEHETTKRQKFDAKEILKCENCENNMNRQLPNGFSFRLKGEGWSGAKGR